MKNWITFIITIVMYVSFNTQIAQAETTFEDLHKTPWAKDEILYLSDQGIIDGYGNGLFGPKDPLTRAQAVMMLVNHLYPETSASGKPGFNDLSTSNFYYEAIAVASEKGIVNGYPDGSFKPYGKISRAEAVHMIHHAYGIERQPDSNVTFTDLKDGDWHTAPVLDLASQGIINGYHDGTFKPENNIIRAEFSVALAYTLNDDLRPVEDMTAHFIDVGQGDSTLLETPSGKTILIDGGRKSAGEEVVDYLASAGIDTIDLLVATHPDADHIGGLIDVLETMDVKQVLDSGKEHTTDTYIEYLDLIDKKDIPFETAVEGEVLSYEDMSMKVMNSKESSSDNNESSIVLKVSHGEIDFLLTGDATIQNEEEMLPAFNLEAEILKVGHHGASTSTSLAFIDEVQPEVGILSYGENSYGHPDSEVVDRLWEEEVKLYSTCDQGDIAITSTGSSYDVNASTFNGSDPCIDDQDDGHNDGNNDHNPGLINVNTAGGEELQKVNGIGPETAANIIAYRGDNGDFQTYEDLLKVKFIGPVKLEKMKPQITL